jgi:hypothetical protein
MLITAEGQARVLRIGQAVGDIARHFAHPALEEGTGLANLRRMA